MPNGYDNDITDSKTIDRLSRMNSNLPVDMVGSPALKKAEMDASWAASDREDKANTERLNGEYEGNFYDDSNINSDPNSSDGSGITDAPGVSASSDRIWNRNNPNEDTRYYERQETDPFDGEVLDLSTNESKLYKSIKKMVENKIRKNPIAFGLREKKSINEIGDTSKGQYAIGKLAARQQHRDKNSKVGKILLKEISFLVKTRNMHKNF